MRRPPVLPLIAAGLLGVGAPCAASARSAPRNPVVVELYTAQGCASCPQADKLLEEIGGRKGVIALSFPVDYWDYLGWADTFAQPVFTERQRAYASRLKVREIYTPEVVVDGRKEAAGLEEGAIDSLIKEEARAPDYGPRVQFQRGDTRVRVGPGRTAAPRSDVWLVRYDPTELSVKVKAGDNKGKTVVQRYVVRQLARLGGYTGGTRSYAVPKPAAPGLSTVVLVQGAKGGGIVGLGSPAP